MVRHQLCIIIIILLLLLISCSCLSGVPKGSILVPLRFAMFISPIANVLAHWLQHHQYAEDTELSMSVMPSIDCTAICNCVSDVTCWFLETVIQLNPNKTEAVPFKCAHNEPRLTKLLMLKSPE